MYLSVSMMRLHDAFLLMAFMSISVLLVSVTTVRVSQHILQM